MLIVPNPNPGILLRRPRLILSDQRTAAATLATWNETSVNFGQPRGLSRVIAGVYAVRDGTAGISSISVGSDTSPTELVSVTAAGAQYKVWIFSANPNAESGTVSITYSGGSHIFHGMAVWRLNNLLSATPFHTASVGVSSGNLSTTLNIPTRGCALGVGGVRITGPYYITAAQQQDMAAQTGRSIQLNNSGSDWQWTGLTKLYQTLIGSGGSASNRALCCASWE